jgi:hypothetical protein
LGQPPLADFKVKHAGAGCIVHVFVCPFDKQCK